MVISVAYFAESAEIRDSVLRSDYVRNETLKRLLAHPSYYCESLKWKNRYYDYFKKQVLKELSSVVAAT